MMLEDRLKSARNVKSIATVALFAGIITLFGCAKRDQAVADVAARPNILVILADDLGYSDIGPFGGEIKTPNLDALAASGLTMSNFHVHTVCTPTRAMLLTGVDNHLAGIGTMAGEQRGAQVGAKGYEAYLNDSVVTIASLLKDAGYETMISGKWDLGGRNDEALLPDKRGFDKSFVLVEGSADHFAEIPALAELDSIHYRENGEAVHIPPDFYSSDYYAGKIIEQIGDRKSDDAPFFAYLAFTAPHYPLQAPDGYIEKYAGVYKAGYEKIRLARIARMKQLGVISKEFQAAEPSGEWPRWEELSPELRALEVRRMQVYAGMVEAMDANIGRVIDHLKKIGAYENTLIVFLSDNGAEGGNPLDWAPFYFDWAESTYDLSLENTGRPGSFAWYGPQWAHVSAAPFRLFKGFATEGGTRSPTIIVEPGRIKSGTRSDEYATVLDLPATFLDVAHIAPPGAIYKGKDIHPQEGRSLANFLYKNETPVHGPDDVTALEILDRRSVRKGDWKIVWSNPPWGEKGWELFNVVDDPAEAHNLAVSNPEKLEELLALWRDYVERDGLILLDDYYMGWTNGKSHFTWLPPSMRGAENERNNDPKPANE